MKSTLLVLSGMIASMALIAGCDKSTGPISDGSVPSFRIISSQLRSYCPSLDPSVADAFANTPERERPATPWPMSADSVEFAVYDSNGFLVKHVNGAFPPFADTSSYLVHIMWDTKDSEGNRVGTGLYFMFSRLYDSTGAIVGRDSICIGVRNAGT